MSYIIFINLYKKYILYLISRKILIPKIYTLINIFLFLFLQFLFINRFLSTSNCSIFSSFFKSIVFIPFLIKKTEFRQNLIYIFLSFKIFSLISFHVKPDIYSITWYELYSYFLANIVHSFTVGNFPVFLVSSFNFL